MKSINNYINESNIKLDRGDIATCINAINYIISLNLTPEKLKKEPYNIPGINSMDELSNLIDKLETLRKN